MGGQSKSQIVGYKYSLYAHFIFGAGVADFVSKIWFRDLQTIAWEGKQDVNGIIAINKPDLFGGQSSQGGVVGNIAFMNGAVDQAQNAYQVGFRGALTPAYHGVMGIIWQDLNIGMNPYLPTWGVEWSRIHKRMSLDGTTDRVQWYDAKAAIPFQGTLPVTSLFSAEYWDYKWYSALDSHATGDGNKGVGFATPSLAGWTTNQAKASVPFVSNTANFPISDGSGNQTVMWYRWNFTPKNAQNIKIDVSTLFQFDIWINGTVFDNISSGSKTLTIPASKLIVGGNNVIAIRASGGAFVAPHYSYYYQGNLPVSPPSPINYPLNEYIANTLTTVAVIATACAHHISNSYSAGHPALPWTPNPSADVYVADGSGILYTTQAHIISAQGGTNQININKTLVSTSNPNTISFTVTTAQVFDINPIHWLREFKTEPWSSARIDESKLPDSVWKDAADTVYSEGLGVTFFYDGSQSIESAMSEVCRHIGAETYNDRQTGEFKIKLIRNDYNIATIPSFNESNIIDMSKDDTPIFGQLTTDVVVNFTDTANAFVEASITVQDIALAQQQGKRITANLDYKGFTSAEVAGRKAQQMLNTLSKPLQKRSFVVRMSAGKDLNKGDVFKFSWVRENITDMVMRITDMNFGNGISNRIKIDAVQDEFAMPTTSFIAPPTSDWTPPFSEPTALNDRLIIEAPYLELVQLTGQAAFDLQLSDAPESAYIIAAAGSQTNATKSMMYDGISNYSQVGVLDFCPTAELNENISYLDETFDITNVKNIDQIELGTWCQIGDEILRVDAISNSIATMGRGCLDTLPALHSTGAKIWFWDNASLLDSTEFVDGNTVNVKLLTINPRGQLALSDAPIDSIELVGRPARPYNMANLRLNDIYYATSITGDLVLKWANRNRLSQTSATIYDFNDGNITPESGVTYNINLIDDSDLSVALSLTGVTGTTNTITTSTLSGLGGSLILQIQAVRAGLISYQNYSIPFTNLNYSRLITDTGLYVVTDDGKYITIS